MEKNPSWAKYAVILQPVFAEIFNPDSPNYIDPKQFEDDDNLKAFMHALATAGPCFIFNMITGENKNHLEFNHVANALVFEFSKLKTENQP